MTSDRTFSGTLYLASGRSVKRVRLMRELILAVVAFGYACYRHGSLGIFVFSFYWIGIKLMLWLVPIDRPLVQWAERRGARKDRVSLHG